MRFLQNDYIKQRAGAKTSCKFNKTTGGSDGIRDEGMLDMALNNPFQAFGGKELYPSIQAKAARLCFGLVKNHNSCTGIW